MPIVAGWTLLLVLFATAAQAQEYRWVNTGQPGDWGGRDQASTSYSTPKRFVKGNVLCDRAHAGNVAVCWTNRPTGFPGVPADHTDIVGNPAQWCTYKTSAIRIFTNQDGGAKEASQVWVCGPVAD
jgi:hypothetical protein